MVRLLSGANRYAISQEVAGLQSAFAGEVEKVDGALLQLNDLPQLLSGGTLFAERRLVVVSNASENATVWQALPEFLEKAGEDVEVILVESAPDKRTKTYKALQRLADVKEFPLLTERDSSKAEQWIMEEAKRMGFALDKPAARELLRRSLLPAERGQPTIDQWQAVHSLEKLSVFGKVTVETVEKYIDPQSVDSVFGIFETALKGDRQALHRLLAELEPREDPYKVFGLLTSQVFQLAALAVSDEPLSETAKAIGAHPFVAGKLAPAAKKLSRQQLRRIILAMSEADEAMKTSKGTPWLLIERALMNIVAAVRPT